MLPGPLHDEWQRIPCAHDPHRSVASDRDVVEEGAPQRERSRPPMAIPMDDPLRWKEQTIDTVSRNEVDIPVVPALDSPYIGRRTDREPGQRRLPRRSRGRSPVLRVPTLDAR